MIGASVLPPWHQFYGDKSVPAPTHQDALASFRGAATVPSADIDYFGTRISFAEIDVLSDKLAAWAIAQGIKRGDRLSIFLQNVPSFVIAAVAAWKIGAVPVPGNPAYRSAELVRLFADSEPALVICHDLHVPEVRKAFRAMATSVRLLVVSPRDHAALPDARVLPEEVTASDEDRLLSILTEPALRSPARLEASPEDLGLLLYTSGTTGHPKGAMLRHRGLASNGELMAKWCGLHQDSRILAVAPLFHITGFVCHMLMSFAMRCSLILTYRFEPRMVLDVIRRTRPTYTVGAVTVFNALAALPEAGPEDFGSFDTVYSGGAPIAPALQATIRERLGIALHNCYGMTETCAPTHMTPRGIQGPVDPTSGSLSIGVPLWQTGARIIGEHAQELPVGEVGEICLAGPQIMAGYWRKPDETADSIKDGWLRSGDIGFMDKGGWFYLVDRKKDMINASGFKVWPREVEDALYSHPAVLEAAVVGEADAYRGETVIAYVSLRDGLSAKSGELVTHCRQLLAGYKVPREVRFLAELPKTATGKIQRNVLRAKGHPVQA
jgi:long-chain acyl-CoA synthetase